MRQSINNKKFSFWGKSGMVLYLLLLLILAAATFVENAFGTSFVQRYIYGSAWFVALWAALAAAGLAVMITRRMWHNVPALMLHTSLLLILLGAAVTFFCGQKGYLHLSEGSSTDFCVEEGTNRQIDFKDFVIRLDSFRVQQYPGTTAPSDYISYVTITQNGIAQAEAISMNNILEINGYRFYQTSFDEDLHGTLLSVNHDPWGIALTYAGYLLFALSVLLLLFAKRSTFRRLSAHPLLQKTLPLALLLLASVSISAHDKLPVLARSTADSLASRQIIYQNRIAPFGTMAHDVMLKLYGKTTYRGFTAEQVVGSLILYPETWHFEPLLLIKDKNLRHELGIEGKYARMADLYENGHFRFDRYVRTSARQNAFGKAVTQTEEKAALLIMLCRGTLFQPLPANSPQALPAAKVKAELFYNKLNMTGLLFKINLSLGLLAFVLFVTGVVRGRRFRWANVLFYVQLIHSFAFLSVALALRWYISGHLPLTNGYETMIFVAWAILLITFLLGKKSDLVPAAGLLLSGFMLLVSSIGSANPQITTLMPVLMSPWLSSHVSSIMISYALFGFMALNGIAALLLYFLSENGRLYAEKLMIISRLLLYPAVGCLAIGIFLGAVWANVSWGRYWGWDPKEVWALITMLVYAIGFHGKSLHWLQRPVYFHLFCIVALLTVIMTYFGVNILFAGMHSYA